MEFFGRFMGINGKIPSTTGNYCDYDIPEVKKDTHFVTSGDSGKSDANPAWMLSIKSLMALETKLVGIKDFEMRSLGI